MRAHVRIRIKFDSTIAIASRRHHNTAQQQHQQTAPPPRYGLCVIALSPRHVGARARSHTYRAYWLARIDEWVGRVRLVWSLLGFFFCCITTPFFFFCLLITSLPLSLSLHCFPLYLTVSLSLYLSLLYVNLLLPPYSSRFKASCWNLGHLFLVLSYTFKPAIDSSPPFDLIAFVL